ncbi:MAG: cadmium-translocating P-type ATPase [Clostridia bacterium]|nr:cadmium-translocating P-type ATPase [Clostridia bacterium]
MSCHHCENQHHHEHEHHHEKEENLSKYLYGIGILFFIVSFLPIFAPYKIELIVITLLCSGYEMLLNGIKNIFHLNFEEETLMTIAVISAFAIGEFTESCLVILLYRFGEFLEQRASNKSEDSIKEIVKIKADTANRVVNNTIETVDVKEVKVDDMILIKPGEKIPVDGIIIYGESDIDTSTLTGESAPVYVTKETEVLSGGINLTGAITCRVIRDVEHSTASQIVDLVYEATNNKGKTEKFITRFSKIYTPIVILVAILIAIIPFVFQFDTKEWILRALIFLVASCPCSLVISVPLSFFTSLGKISQKGMIVKGTKHIENLAKASVVAFDKTGTLTTGKMKIEQMEVLGEYTKEEILSYMYSLELLSNHPIGTAIKDYRDNIEIKEVEGYKEIAGHGLYGKIEQKEVLFGNHKLLEQYQITKDNEIPQHAICLVIERKIAGYIILTQEIRKESKNLVKDLKHIGVKKIIMLTGDNEKSAETIGKELNFNEIKASLLPQEKLKTIEELKKKGENVIFVGDGINDSPVLASSNFGIAMGAGANIASITADGILISNNLSTLPSIIKTAKRTMKVVKANIIFSLIVKLIVLVLGAIGIAPIWLAILADTGVTFLTVVNAIRNIK